MPRSVFAKVLFDRRRGFVGWSIGVAGTAVLLLAFYPVVRDQAADLNKMVADFPAALRALSGLGESPDFGSPDGYLRGRVFGNTVPILFLIFAIGAASRTLGGEEDAGTLELLLAHPVTRSRVMLEKFAAVVVLVAGLGIVLFVALVAMATAVGMHVGVGGLATQVLLVVLLADLFGGLGLAAGSALGKRSSSSATAAVVAVAAFLLYSLAPLWRPLEPWGHLSPFDWAIGGTALTGGSGAGDAAVLALSVALVAAFSVWAFGRRDLRGS